MKKDVPQKMKMELVSLCANSLLEMVFAHNFVHGDLHPGKSDLTHLPFYPTYHS